MNNFQKIKVEKKNLNFSHKITRIHIRLFISNIKREWRQKVDYLLPKTEAVSGNGERLLSGGFFWGTMKMFCNGLWG